MKVRDRNHVDDFHDLCPGLSPGGSFGESRKVDVMEFGLYLASPPNTCVGQADIFSLSFAEGQHRRVSTTAEVLNALVC